MSRGFSDNNKDSDSEAMTEHSYLKSFRERMEEKLQIKASMQGYDIQSDRF